MLFIKKCYFSRLLLICAVLSCAALYSTAMKRAIDISQKKTTPNSDTSSEHLQGNENLSDEIPDNFPSYNTEEAAMDLSIKRRRSTTERDLPVPSGSQADVTENYERLDQFRSSFPSTRSYKKIFPATAFEFDQNWPFFFRTEFNDMHFYFSPYIKLSKNLLLLLSGLEKMANADDITFWSVTDKLESRNLEIRVNHKETKTSVFLLSCKDKKCKLFDNKNIKTKIYAFNEITKSAFFRTENLNKTSTSQFTHSQPSTSTGMTGRETSSNTPKRNTVTEDDFIVTSKLYFNYYFSRKTNKIIAFSDQARSEHVFELLQINSRAELTKFGSSNSNLPKLTFVCEETQNDCTEFIDGSLNQIDEQDAHSNPIFETTRISEKSNTAKNTHEEVSTAANQTENLKPLMSSSRKQSDIDVMDESWHNAVFLRTHNTMAVVWLTLLKKRYTFIEIVKDKVKDITHTYHSTSDTNILLVRYKSITVLNCIDTWTTKIEDRSRSDFFHRCYLKNIGIFENELERNFVYITKAENFEIVMQNTGNEEDVDVDEINESTHIQFHTGTLKINHNDVSTIDNASAYKNGKYLLEKKLIRFHFTKDYIFIFSQRDGNIILWCKKINGITQDCYLMKKSADFRNKSLFASGISKLVN